MTTLARRNSSIHKVREYSLPKITLEDEYEVVHVIQEGWRSRLLLVEHKPTRDEVVLKAVHKDTISRIEFFREFHYNYYLSPHPNILNAYDVAFEANNYYMFAQEYAPFGDVTSNMADIGLGEMNAKKITLQLASALEFMHSKDLVHRDINMDNILVFMSDFSEIKLCDFGSTRKTGTLIKKKNVWLPYAPPEIVDAVQNEGYHVTAAHDVWQLGILIYVLLTGVLPWQKADLTDPHYIEYINWRKRKIVRTPKRFANFTSRLLRMFKRLLEPKPEKRAGVREVCKYMQDKWLVKAPKKELSDPDNQSVCYSTFSFHSSKLEKDKVLFTLKAHGLETTVDRTAKRKRIHEWLERSLNNKVVSYMNDELLDSFPADCHDDADIGRIRPNADSPIEQPFCDGTNSTLKQRIVSNSDQYFSHRGSVRRSNVNNQAVITSINMPIAHAQREKLQEEARITRSKSRDSIRRSHHGREEKVPLSTPSTPKAISFHQQPSSRIQNNGATFGTGHASREAQLSPSRLSTRKVSESPRRHRSLDQVSRNKWMGNELEYSAVHHDSTSDSNYRRPSEDSVVSTADSVVSVLPSVSR